ncbi:RHS repeat-associated core domain-containing protein [Nocardia cyriacigeorgica]|uniref:RHS repeat-associated core domain-containing protein n=2 Tax=Nocardia cyriacigeorgica TaxID=135487 RepID=A0A5R8PH34_9NOCA|nr:RHS repeat-associated core domain-containing protein [Nocardia cyriacigeorgica]
MVYGHDQYGRRTSRTTPTGGTTTWTHDVAGRVTAMTTDGHSISFTHDPLGRTTGWRIGNISIDRAFTSVGHTTHQIVTAHLPGAPTPGTPTPSAPEPQILRRDDYTWRPDGYLTSHTTTHPGTTPDHRQYTLDPIGRVTAITRNGALAEHYTYDKLSNITSGGVITPDATTLGPGHPTTPGQPGPHQGYPASPGLPPNPAAPQQHSPANTRREYHNNLLIRDGRHQYHYDPAGRLIRKTTTRLSRKPDVWHYRYNAFDQLTDVYTPDGQWWHYTYDALGRRTSKQRITDNHRRIEHVYTWDGNHLTEDRTAASTLQWSYRPGTYAPITETVKHEGKIPDLSAFATDLVGTPVQLLDPSIPRVRGFATSDWWGRTTWHGEQSPLRFPGQIHDIESGLHHNHHRVFDPETGGYLTSDPLGLAPSPNPRSYPHNPTVWSDPLGLMCQNANQQTSPATVSENETISPKPVKPEEVLDRWKQFLGPGEYSNIHPRTGLPDPHRIVSEDGLRSIRFGPHEMGSKPTKFHYHEETWQYDPVANHWHVENVVVRVPFPKGTW